MKSLRKRMEKPWVMWAQGEYGKIETWVDVQVLREHQLKNTNIQKTESLIKKMHITTAFGMLG